MTIQDDLARPWFQPLVPSEAQQQKRPDLGGPPTTRIVGELPLDEVMAPARQDPRPPAPARVEVTQPYIPAIRDEQPEFAKQLNPDPPAAASTSTVTGPQPAVEPPATEPAGQAPRPAAPVKKRSLMRRVVRRIIGPDLLRKDPPKKRR
ncbi:hypothetical protein GCM10011581_49970 [Saccharopolyspora subtropica]|uniref:Uncharacterized protein n=1 Tax=Saccharopolyspora thermophila TaxID=89367 RepID=A0A917KAK0_9PSEU|nr:hypothetical protein [Saccharopolyspora subtropica]GGJ07054.1 hypothetical protein GCM10011581_49970 [Saccharopolyspora subtropica]